MSNPGYVFFPRWRYITAISQGQKTTITTSEVHDYTDGEIVSFRVTKPYGMVELNNVHAKVLSHTDFTLTVGVESTNFNAFIYPASNGVTPPVVVPSASGILPDYYPPTVTLFDAFDNVSTT